MISGVDLLSMTIGATNKENKQILRILSQYYENTVIIWENKF